jgi:hypothetical protein
MPRSMTGRSTSRRLTPRAMRRLNWNSLTEEQVGGQ